MDGVVIAAAFLTSIPLGVAASLAVIAHEIPQEVGDFAILLDNGYGRTKAIVLNGLSAAATLPGAKVIARSVWVPTAPLTRFGAVVSSIETRISFAMQSQSQTLSAAIPRHAPPGLSPAAPFTHA